MLIICLAAGKTTGLAYENPCPHQFMQAAQQQLEESQNPRDCSTARLLVLETFADDFEGMASVMMGVAEALAEAHAGERAVIFGPLRAQPAVLRTAECDQGQKKSWECYFEPLGRCSWANVGRNEQKALMTHADSCEARVKLSTPVRGAPTLYSPPETLRKLLPKDMAPEGVAKCWASAVMGYVVRFRPEIRERFEKRRLSLFDGADGAGYAAAHLRAGDTQMHANQYNGRVYTNKPNLNATVLGTALRNYYGNEAADNLYLATDYYKADKAVRELTDITGIREAVVLPRYRTAHGSHNTAFAVTLASIRNLLPMELWPSYTGNDGRYSGPDAQKLAEADQQVVRLEALEDFYLLSHADVIVGSASSHFAVGSWLYSYTRQDGRAADAIWVDQDMVRSGIYANGFMHGQVNTTFELRNNPEQRVLIATMRWMDWPYKPERDPAIVFHERYSIPIVPAESMQRMRDGWSCKNGIGADNYIRECVIRIMDGETLDGECSSSADLLNVGVDFWELFNVELAIAAWNAVLDLPDYIDDGEQLQNAKSIAAENMEMIFKRRYSQIHSYLRP